MNRNENCAPLLTCFNESDKGRGLVLRLHDPVGYFVGADVSTPVRSVKRAVWECRECHALRVWGAVDEGRAFDDCILKDRIPPLKNWDHLPPEDWRIVVLKAREAPVTRPAFERDLEDSAVGPDTLDEGDICQL